MISFDAADQSIIDARLLSVDAGRVEDFSTQERACSSLKGFIQSSSRDLINYISFLVVCDSKKTYGSMFRVCICVSVKMSKIGTHFFNFFRVQRPIEMKLGSKNHWPKTHM